MKTVQDYLTREEDNEPDLRDNMEKNKKLLYSHNFKNHPEKKPKDQNNNNNNKNTK